MATEDSEFVLGLDIGTTSVKASLVAAATGRLHASRSQATEAGVASPPPRSEQDVGRICAALHACVGRLPSGCMPRVVRVGVCGQMHGVVLWRRGAGWRPEGPDAGEVSRLVTWQDGRCSAAFLAALPAPDSPLRLSAGHGCATLFWLRRHQPQMLARFDRAGTVHDFVVAALCGLDGAAVSVQNAASWGYVDPEAGVWNEGKLSSAGFPVELLPKIVPTGSYAGTLTSSWHGIPEGTPVAVAFGDMQCSVLSALQNESDAVLNISTSAQLSFIMPKGFSPPMSASNSAIEFFPYFESRYLAVAASLNGGNVLAGFVNMLQQWTHDLGSNVAEEKIWETILPAAQTDSKPESELTIVPTLLGERHLPDQRASVLNIDPHNVSLGEVTRSICRGVIANIRTMMPREKLLEAGVQQIVGTGSALLRNPVLQQELEGQFSIPVFYRDDSDAAHGAALAVIRFSDIH